MVMTPLLTPTPYHLSPHPLPSAPITVPNETPLTLPSLGLNKLSGFAITSISILLRPLSDGTNMAGTVSIPNASPITFSMGNVTMDILHNNTLIGTSTLPNLTLHPGENIVNTTSIVNQTTVLTLITTKYHDGKIPLDFVGTSSVFEGEHLTYFEEALRGVTQHVVLDAGAALRGIGLNVTEA